MSCSGHKINDIESLKMAIKAASETLSQNFLNKAIDQWRSRLNYCVENKGTYWTPTKAMTNTFLFSLCVKIKSKTNYHVGTYNLQYLLFYVCLKYQTFQNAFLYDKTCLYFDIISLFILFLMRVFKGVFLAHPVY